MPDLNNLSNLSMKALEHYDFSNENNLVKAEDIGNLLKKDGIFTLDDKGKVTVVTAGRRDNAIYRFFKGLFNRDYKIAQENIDRAIALKKNASFNELLRNTCIKYAVSKHDNGDINSDKNKLISERIIGIYESEKELSTASIKKAINHFYKFTSPIGDSIGLAQGETTNGILVKGENLTPEQFINKYADNGNVPVSNKTLATSLMIKAAKSPVSFAEIGKLKDANTIRKLLYKPTLTDAEKVTFKACIHSIISEMKNRMVNGVEVALAQGKDLKATANQLKEIFTQLSDKDADDSFMLDVKLREGFAKIDGIVNLSLPDAEDVNAYKTIDADDKTGLAAATAKLKTALPDLDDRQIAKIIAFVPRNDEGIIKEKKLDAYIDVIKKGYPEFKAAMKEFSFALKVNTPEAYAKAQLSFAKVFEKVGGQAEGRDEISSVAANLVHFMNIKESSEFLDTINLNRIENYYNSVYALRDTIPTEVNGSDDFVAAVNRETNSLVFSMTVLEQICYTVKANKTGDASMTPAETQVPDASLKQNSDEGINAALMIGFLNQQKYMSKIDEKVSTLPQGVRENAKELLIISLKDALRKTRYTSLEAHEQTFNTYLEKYFNTISNSPELMKLLDKSSFKAENLTKFTDELIDGQKLFVNEFNKEKLSNKNFREDGVNKTFITDAHRYALTSFNGVDFGAIESKDVVSTFCSMAEQNNIPASFIPFVTFYMSQSGLPYLVQADLAHSLTNLINPDLPSVNDLFDKGIGQIQNDFSNAVKVENNIMTISTDFRISGTMIDIEKIPKNYMENNGTFPLQTMQLNIQIDLTKGVDEQGVPKSITFLPPKLGQEIK